MISFRRFDIKYVYFKYNFLCRSKFVFHRALLGHDKCILIILRQKIIRGAITAAKGEIEAIPPCFSPGKKECFASALYCCRDVRSSSCGQAFVQRLRIEPVTVMLLELIDVNADIWRNIPSSFVTPRARPQIVLVTRSTTELPFVSYELE